MSEEKKLDYTNEQIRALARIGDLGYNEGNYLPDSCTWKLYKQDIIEIVERTAKRYMKDVESVSLGLTPIQVKEEGEKPKTMNVPCAWVWLPKDSENLVDKSLYNTDSGVKFPIKRKSKSLVEFAKKFCKDGKPNTMRSEKGKSDALIALIANIMQLEFDQKDIAYGRAFGREFCRNTEIKLDFWRANEIRKNDFDIEFIVVKKSVVKKNFDSSENRPRNSFNL